MDQLVVIAVFFLTLSCQTQGDTVNDNPVIGILAQDVPSEFQKYGTQYIDAEYVKYLEMAGSKVIPIKVNQTEAYYSTIFKQVNGILLPGGDRDLMTSEFAKTSRYFYQRALEANDNGDYFPIWGTCQGFQMLAVLTSRKNVLLKMDAENITMPLDLSHGANSSRLLENAPPNIMRYLTTEPVTANFHSLGVSTTVFETSQRLFKFYRLISTNYDRNRCRFVSTMEGFNYPFYGTQWHPEKNIFLYDPTKTADHSKHAVAVSQYMADFFVSEARKSSHKFASEHVELTTLIENDPMTYFPDTGFQVYFYKA